MDSAYFIKRAAADAAEVGAVFGAHANCAKLIARDLAHIDDAKLRELYVSHVRAMHRKGGHSISREALDALGV